MDEVFERDDDNRIEEQIARAIDDRTEQMGEMIMQRVAALLPQQQQDRHQSGTVGDSVEDEGSLDERPFNQRRPQRFLEDNDRRWESEIRTDIPEFHGGLQAEEFLDWLSTVEEILEFREVPDERRVALNTTRFWGCAIAWWQQLKLTRSRMGKGKISSWEKMKKHLRAALLPYNYQRVMYQRLQTLR